VVYRIAIFYVGSVLLLAMLLPYTAYTADESPFVTVFGQMGIPWIGDAMNVIVLTAALSSCNSGQWFHTVSPAGTGWDAGLRWPELAIRARQPASISALQVIAGRLPAPRRAGRCPALIQW
jgi:Amino acid permease